MSHLGNVFDGQIKLEEKKYKLNDIVFKEETSNPNHIHVFYVKISFEP